MKIRHEPIVIFCEDEIPELMTILGIVAMGDHAVPHLTHGAHSIQVWADEQYRRLEVYMKHRND